MATIEGIRMPIAAGAYRDILFPEGAEPDLPRSAWSPGPDRHLSCSFSILTLLGSGIRTYKLIPQCTAPPDPKVLYYLAWDTERKRNVYAIGPEKLDAFGQNLSYYVTAAESIYGVSNGVSIHELNMFRMLQLVRAGDIAAILRHLGNSWLDALQDPLWWLQVGTTVAAAGGGRVVSRKAPIPSEAVVQARQAGADAAKNGYGWIKIGGFMDPDSINGRLMIDGNKVTYTITGINATDSVTNAVKASGQSVAKVAHREMLNQAAQNARRLGVPEFTVVGEQACPNFVEHINRLGAQGGVPGSFRQFKAGPGFPNVEARFQVDKFLTPVGSLEDKIERILFGEAVGRTATTTLQGDANAPQPK